VIHQSYEKCSVSYYAFTTCAFFFFFSQLLSHSLAPPFFFFPPSTSFLLFPLIIYALPQQQRNFTPGGAAEETEPFHVQGTAGLRQKKTNFFLARVKPICSRTKFLCTLSGTGMVSLKTLAGRRAVPAARRGQSRGCAANSPSQAEMCWFRYVAASPQASFTALPSFVPLPLQATGIGIFV